MKFVIAILFALGLYVPMLLAQETEERLPAANPVLGCEEAVTIFQDVSAMGRKDRAARNISKRHAEMASDGWQFVDMEVYVENGDLEGFYLSYTRPTACKIDTEQAG